MRAPLRRKTTTSSLSSELLLDVAIIANQTLCEIKRRKNSLPELWDSESAMLKVNVA